MLATFGFCLEAVAADAPLPTLTSIHQLRNLTPAEANRGYPVHLRAVVTFFHVATQVDPSHLNELSTNMFVQDATGGNWVAYKPGATPVKVGDLLEIEGKTAQSDFAPDIADPHWRVIGRAPLPTPRKEEFGRLASTEDDSVWVEINGIVRSATPTHGDLRMDIAMDGGHVTAYIPDVRRPFPQGLIDAQVRVRGVCGAIFNSKNQLRGVNLFVPGWQQVEVVKPGLAEAFAVPLRPIDSILRFTMEGAAGHRVRIRGTVTLHRRGRFVVIKGEKGAIRVKSDQSIDLYPGDIVEAVGFPAVGENDPMLELGLLRVVAKSDPVLPRPASAQELLRNSIEGELVQIQMKLLDRMLTEHEQILVGKSGSVVVQAQLEDPSSLSRLSGIAPGSQIQLTGICSITNSGTIKLLLRSAQDVAVLSRPPWWTLRRSAWVVGGLSGLVVAIFAWLWILRRKVQAQTEIIRLQLETVTNTVRTLESAQAELRIMKDAAEAANRAKSEFLANMSHEIRTPLNGVLLAAELAAAENLSPSQKDYLQTIRDSGESLLVLLNDLLDLSKVEAGKMDLHEETFAIEHCLRDCTALLDGRARQKSLELKLEVDKQIPAAVTGDALRLRQVILNLAGNAIKFTPAGSVLVRAEYLGQREGRFLCRFSVQDTGVGIPPEKHAAVFREFEQADTSTTRRFGGTGLGLAICRKLVALMGGEIWMESEVGRGSTFVFTALFSEPAAPHKPSSGRPDTKGHTSGSLRILLAEDNAINKRLAMRLLEKNGHSVVAVETGKAAVEGCEADTFDVVLMDVHMPEMDGIEATRLIRQNEKRTGAHVPIIAMTASAMKSDREACAAAGMDGYIAKPISTEELLATLNAIIEARPWAPAP